MTKKNQIYKCQICGNVVEVVEAGAGILVCCGQDMNLFEEKTIAEEQGGEKHVPVLEINNSKVTVKVGSIPHPMEDNHYISKIDIMTGEGKLVASKRLKPGDEPKAEFCLESTEGIYAREYCNIHGLWRN
ncbi:MAG: desulfoferrodoxin [Nanoarchaeota archaeon]|nr:desulfoferrodoxin [Nanoarchaeota archaeon]